MIGYSIFIVSLSYLLFQNPATGDVVSKQNLKIKSKNRIENSKMLKFCGFSNLARHLARKSLNIRTITIHQKNNETLCSAIRVDLENPNSPVSFCEVNKTNLKNYQFPILTFSYDQNDVVEHAQSGES